MKYHLIGQDQVFRILIYIPTPDGGWDAEADEIVGAFTDPHGYPFLVKPHRLEDIEEGEEAPPQELYIKKFILSVWHDDPKLLKEHLIAESKGHPRLFDELVEESRRESAFQRVQEFIKQRQQWTAEDIREYVERNLYQHFAEAEDTLMIANSLLARPDVDPETRLHFEKLRDQDLQAIHSSADVLDTIDKYVEGFIDMHERWLNPLQMDSEDATFRFIDNDEGEEGEEWKHQGD